MNDTTLDHTLSFEVTNNTPPIRFLASLSDGRTVIQDDRPGERSAWLRLAKFLKHNINLKITCIRLQGPNGQDIPMPSGQKGYFFGNKHQKVFPGGEATYVGVGYYDGNQVAARWFKTTDFKITHCEERTKEKCGFFLIENTDG